MVMTNEVLYKTSIPFRLGARATAIHKVVPDTNPNDMQDRLDATHRRDRMTPVWYLYNATPWR